jgi:hypothetical protein
MVFASILGGTPQVIWQRRYHHSNSVDITNSLSCSNWQSTVHLVGSLSLGCVGTVAPTAPIILCHVCRAVFEHLSDIGVAVHTFDVHGHGKSEPKAADDRCLISNYKDLVCMPQQYMMQQLQQAWHGHSNAATSQPQQRSSSCAATSRAASWHMSISGFSCGWSMAHTGSHTCTFQHGTKNCRPTWTLHCWSVILTGATYQGCPGAAPGQPVAVAVALVPTLMDICLL